MTRRSRFSSRALNEQNEEIHLYRKFMEKLTGSPPGPGSPIVPTFPGCPIGPGSPRSPLSPGNPGGPFLPSLPTGPGGPLIYSYVNISLFFQVARYKCKLVCYFKSKNQTTHNIHTFSVHFLIRNYTQHSSLSIRTEVFILPCSPREPSTPWGP